MEISCSLKRTKRREQRKVRSQARFEVRLSEVHHLQRIRSHVAASHWPVEDFLVGRLSVHLYA